MTAKEYFIESTYSIAELQNIEDVMMFAEEYHEHQVQELNLVTVTHKTKMDRLNPCNIIDKIEENDTTFALEWLGKGKQCLERRRLSISHSIPLESSK